MGTETTLSIWVCLLKNRREEYRTIPSQNIKFRISESSQKIEKTLHHCPLLTHSAVSIFLFHNAPFTVGSCEGPENRKLSDSTIPCLPVDCIDLYRWYWFSQHMNQVSVFLFVSYTDHFLNYSQK